MTLRPTLLFALLVFSVNTLLAQIAPGQILLNGNASFFSNHSVSEGFVPPIGIGTGTIPAFNYEQKQDVYNLTLAPRAHYFLSEKWSVGLGFGWRRIVNDRTIPSVNAQEVSTLFMFSRQTKNKVTTASYAPRLEVARHWYFGKRLCINVFASAGWQLLRIKRETSTTLPVATSVISLEGWTVSPNGLQFTPLNDNLMTTTDTDQYWLLDLSPQIRYAFAKRFGATATFGGFSISQEFKSTSAGFQKAAPNIGININPSTWTFGLYYLFGDHPNETGNGG